MQLSRAHCTMKSFPYIHLNTQRRAHAVTLLKNTWGRVGTAGSAKRQNVLRCSATKANEGEEIRIQNSVRGEDAFAASLQDHVGKSPRPS